MDNLCGLLSFIFTIQILCCKLCPSTFFLFDNKFAQSTPRFATWSNTSEIAPNLFPNQLQQPDAIDVVKDLIEP